MLSFAQKKTFWLLLRLVMCDTRSRTHQTSNQLRFIMGGKETEILRSKILLLFIRIYKHPLEITVKRNKFVERKTIHIDLVVGIVEKFNLF